MCIFVCVFHINNTGKGNTSLMLSKLLLLLLMILNVQNVNVQEVEYVITRQDLLFIRFV